MTPDVKGRMHGDHPYETDALDDEIARALAVDPSPDFVRRVRTRMAGTPRPSLWRLWPLASATLATAGVAAAYLVWSVPGQVERRPQVADVASVSAETSEPSRPAAPTLTTPSTPPAAADVVTTTARRRDEPRRAVRATAAPGPSPELAGLLALRDRAWSEPIGMPHQMVQQEMAAPMIAALAFEPIAIAPLSDVAQISGDRPW